MDSVRLNTVELGSPLEGPSPAPPSPASPPAGTRATAEGGFADALEHAVGQVDQLQLEADAQSEQIARGGGNLHETALALEKADIGMRVMLKVRNKLVDAYNDVMRMSM